MNAHTPGRLIPCRSHEDHGGPMFDIEPDEAAYYNAKPFTQLLTEAGETVVNAHDLFEFKPGDAERLAACWNACEGLSLEQVQRLGVALHNEGVITETLRRVLDTGAPTPATREE